MEPRDPDPRSDGNITIAQGTEIATEKGEAVFETTEPRTLQRGQARIDAPIRAGDKFKGPAGKVEAGKIIELSQIITGISRVSNFEPTFLAADDESDEDLRSRAKMAVRGLGKGTILALKRAVFENHADLKEISDPNTSGKQTPPGTVALLVETEPGEFPSLVAAVNDTRAAGVQVTVAARFVFVKPRIVCKIPAVITAEGKTKFANEIITALQQYIEGLKPKTPATGEGLLAAIGKVKDVTDPKIVDVRTSRADIGKPGTKPLVEALVANLANVNPSDIDALRTAVGQTIDAEGPALVPSGRREPDRSLVQGANGTSGKGTRATDGEIEAGKFVVAPPEQFSLILDMEPADIIFSES